MQRIAQARFDDKEPMWKRITRYMAAKGLRSISEAVRRAMDLGMKADGGF